MRPMPLISQKVKAGRRDSREADRTVRYPLLLLKHGEGQRGGRIVLSLFDLPGGGQGLSEAWLFTSPSLEGPSSLPSLDPPGNKSSVLSADWNPLRPLAVELA